MKALLLKDFYMMKKYCRSYLLVMIIFAGLSVFDPTWRMSSLSLLCLMAAMMPVTLQAYDERSHWNEYCAALPYGKWDVVSSKYVLCLINQLAVTAVFAVLWLISGGNDIGEFFMTASVGFCCSCFSSAVVFPFVLWLGVEKGRVLYYVFIVIGFGASGLLKSFSVSESLDIKAFYDIMTVVLPVLSVLVYIVSWVISVVIYGKREIR